MYTRACSSVVFPMHERVKGHRSVALRKELERTQWIDAAELERLRLARLKDFLVQAGVGVPYYRRLFERVGFDPRQVSSIADLARLPLLSKALIRENLDALKSQSAGTLVRYNTGGSTGEPLVFHMGMERISHDVAAKWRATRWWGVDIGDPEIVLWGSPIELGAQDRLRSIRDWVFRSRLLPAFDMSERRMDEFLQVILRIKPRMLFGYASALSRLAQHAVSKGIAMGGAGIRVIFTTGETLYPQQRRVLEEVFRAPVANGYGSRDAGFIAHQCPAGSLHLSAEHLIVELVDDDGTPVPVGTMGEVVVTHLATRDFPFIRYRTGDMAVFGTTRCACGRSLPVLEAVYGRSTDFIRTPAGGAMHALALIYEVRGRAGVHAFKFLQAEDFSIELQLAAGPELTPAVEREMLTSLEHRLGPGVPIRINRLAQIPMEKSGKYRYVVSRAGERPA